MIVEDRKSGKLRIEKGIRQGDTISPKIIYIGTWKICLRRKIGATNA